MNRIRLLPEHVANQIAAGEVVERPASVVKELVENALDAQASRIAVEIQAGGRSLIRVTDDGCGMSRDDALLAFERHATSKIQKAEDLDAIATMGFRGEALPSIASVSRLTLTTRERSADVIEATQVVFNGGKLVDVRSASGPPGTSLEVRQLFFNLPARRKFLRSEETERMHIQHYLTLAALAFPSLGFTFVHDGRTVWQLPPVPADERPDSRLGALRERLRGFLGADLPLLAVDGSGEVEVASRFDPEVDPRAEAASRVPRTAVRLWGFLGAPGVSRATREDQHVFVNRRPVENRGINFALLEGYHTALMKGRYPVCCLFLEIDPALVDVNIHPAKREVKFREEAQVRAFVSRVVKQVLLGFHLRHRTDTPPAGAPPAVGTARTDVPPGAAGRQAPARTQPASGIPAPPSPPEFAWRGALANTVVPVEPPRPGTEPGPGGLAAATGPVAGSDRPPATETEPANLAPTVAPAALEPTGVPGIPGGVVVQAPSDAATAGESGLPTPLLAVPLRLVGVIGRLYVVLESDRGLVLLDQHAAHERILFEQMLDQLQRGVAPSQRLLLPETVELSGRDAFFVRELLPTLTRLGVGLSEFGERTFLLDGLPPFVRVADARQFVLELVDELKATGEDVNALRLGEHTVAKTVCRHAVKANDPLAGPELERLVEDLRRCAMPYTCPHGRPTLIELSYRELERKFGRTG